MKLSDEEMREAWAYTLRSTNHLENRVWFRNPLDPTEVIYRPEAAYWAIEMDERYGDDD